MSYIILRGRWCDITVLNVHAQTGDIIDDMKRSFYEKLEFPKHYMTILLADFNAKVSRKDTLKSTIGSESLHYIKNDEGLGEVNFATPKNLIVKSTMFPHLNIRKFAGISPDGNTNILSIFWKKGDSIQV
jgi:hypothetical protein